MSAPEPVPPTSRRGDRTRAALVESALTLFAAQGVEATSVDQVTQAAKVAKGTFYVHFERKEDVLLEHAAALVGDLDARPFPDEPRAALHALAQRFVAAQAGTPRAVSGRMVREIIGHRSDWLRVLGRRRALSAVIEPILARGQEVGAIRDDQSPVRLAQALTILWLDNVIGWAERPEPRPLVNDLERATSLFLDGAAVGATPDGKPAP
ncbi:TetR/AcrR family transcriptional regulator [Egibacter rhizosphaerae]|uniref:TetR/AcrR family transcriptional regulator n=2 Tax=Egibacter rhizosphaerae TaxID=1670831 RepID=A0A411YKW2_9ACTN|nr:TetR/AcrR family transcriptional regulator [Egibacter rhizosphaerae]